MERRRFRRVDLSVPISIRSGEEAQTKIDLTGQVRDMSLGGCYSYVSGPCELKRHDQIICSLEVPTEQARWFPFARVLGRGWVVRTETIHKRRRAGESPSEEPQTGIAIAFAPDVTALGTI